MAAHPNQLAALRPGGGAERGVPFHSNSHPICTGLTKAGEPCRATAAYGTDRCIAHGARRAKPDPRRAYVNGALAALHAARRDLFGGAFPRELMAQDAWQHAETLRPGDRARAQADLATAWHARGQDGGAQWRRVVSEVTG